MSNELEGETLELGGPMVVVKEFLSLGMCGSEPPVTSIC
jgi:hypothetical protein